MEVFKSYWIQFVILERNFDSFRVLGPSLDDLRIVFPYGDIVDVFKCDYDIKTITEYPLEEIRKYAFLQHIILQEGAFNALGIPCVTVALI